VKKVSFTQKALLHLEEWKVSDAKMLQKIVSLVLEISSTPFTGTGKPEPLRYDLKGHWSRRINQEHRIVYEVKDDEILIVSCRYHY
jgi:toxin YoeB